MMAANELVSRYQVHGRTADVKRIAGWMVKNLPVGDARRSKFERTLG
jgi:hypothetical protein